MEENILHTNEQPIIETPKRPQFLKVLCILSYIWSGIILLSLFLCLIFSRIIFAFIDKILSGEISMPTIDSTQEQALQTLLDLGQWKFAAIIAGAIMLYMTSLLGVVKMWKQQKWGFYIYATINILGVGYDISSGSYFMAVISMAFIGMYFSNLKYMKQTFIFMGKNALSMIVPLGANNSAIEMGVLIFMIVIDVVFVTLYTKNLKELKNQLL